MFAADTSDQNDGKAEILDAAAQAFMQNGYAATSIDTVAEILGCTKGRIYYHYKSKADLFFDLHNEAMKKNIAILEPIAKGEGSPVARLAAMIRAHAMRIMTQLPYQRISVQGVEMHLTGSTTPAQRKVLRGLMNMRDHYESLFVQVIEEGMQEGELTPCDAHFVAKPLLGALNWMTVWYRPKSGETDQSRNAIAQGMVDFILDGMKARDRKF